jgi:hypothetical protein
MEWERCLVLVSDRLFPLPMRKPLSYILSTAFPSSPTLRLLHGGHGIPRPATLHGKTNQAAPAQAAFPPISPLRSPHQNTDCTEHRSSLDSLQRLKNLGP